MLVETLDLKRQYAHLLKPSAKQAEIVDVPELPFLMIDGEGAPAEEAYQQAVGALYSTAYTLKFAIRKSRAIDYPVMPLEGFWGVGAGAQFSYSERSVWRWTALILLPDLVTAEDVARAAAEADRKKPNPALARLRFERFHEGRAAQIMHIGPYADEPSTVDRLHEFIDAAGFQPHGRHHEIYLSDPGRTAPERMKTILRHAITR